MSAFQQQLDSEDYLLKNRLPALVEALVASIIEYKPEAPWPFVRDVVSKAGPMLSDNPEAIITELIQNAIPDNFTTISTSDGAGNGEEENVSDPEVMKPMSDENVISYLNSHYVYSTFKDIMTRLAENQSETPFSTFLEYIEEKNRDIIRREEILSNKTEIEPEIKLDPEDSPLSEEQLPADTTIVFVLGGPGSGKGTQCDRIVADYGFKHLSAGDLLRDEVASGSETGKMCEQLMTEGKLVPMEVTIALLKTAMIKSGASLFLIDGFPRALDQGHEFESSIKECSLILFFDCPQETMQERLLKRGETSGRSDDNIETIQKRFTTFMESSLPVIEYYEGFDKVAKISAVPPPDEVYASVKDVLESKLPELKPITPQLPADTTIVFVLGGPGSGKGTQCDRIVADYGFKHLSAGDLLRDEVASGSETGKMCEQLMTEGKLVPMEVTIALLKTAMIKSGASLFLIDGFPRALDQGHEFESSIKECSLILFFDCPQETMQERLLKRGETSGRSDDNIETIQKRFTTFMESSLPVIEYYEGFDKVAKISAVPPPDEVYASVKDVLESKLPELKSIKI